MDERSEMLNECAGDVASDMLFGISRCVNRLRDKLVTFNYSDDQWLIVKAEFEKEFGIEIL